MAVRGCGHFPSRASPHTILPLTPTITLLKKTDSWVGCKAVSDRRLRCFARAIDWEKLELGDAGGGTRLFVATTKQGASADGPPPTTIITPTSLAAFVLLDPL